MPINKEGDMPSKYDFMLESGVFDTDGQAYPDPLSINYNTGRLMKVPTSQRIDTRIIAKPWIMLFEKYEINYYLDLLLDINGIRYVTDLTPNDEIYMPALDDIEGFVLNKLKGSE